MPWVRGKWGPPARLVFRGPGPLQLEKVVGHWTRHIVDLTRLKQPSTKVSTWGLKETFIKRYFGSDVFR
jgi:hypothetical protein